LTTAGFAATDKPGGNGSANVIRDNGTIGFGFVNVNVNLVVSPTLTFAGENDLVSVDGWFNTSSVATAGAPGPVSFEVTGPVELTFGPSVVP
jgi:hypothetical protein